MLAMKVWFFWEFHLFVWWRYYNLARYRVLLPASSTIPSNLIFWFSLQYWLNMTFVFNLFISSPIALLLSFNSFIICCNCSEEVEIKKMSSANLKSERYSPSIRIPNSFSVQFKSLKISLKQAEQSFGDIALPCLTLLRNWKGVESWPIQITE